MALFATNTTNTATLINRLGACVKAAFAAMTVANPASKPDGKALLAAQRRAEEARARVDNLLR